MAVTKSFVRQCRIKRAKKRFMIAVAAYVFACIGLLIGQSQGMF